MTREPVFTRLFLGLIVALLAVAPYLAGGTSRNFITLDDSSFIYDNPRVAEGLSLRTALWALRSTENANWYPLTRLTHLADVSLFGMKAGGHHVGSVTWHAAAAVLLFLGLVQMTGKPWRCFVVAALFGVHPLQVESVAWASERSSVLAGFFFGLSLLLWGRYSRQSTAGRYAAVALSLALGLMSKPVLVTLPLALLLLDFWPLGRLHAPGSPPWLPDGKRLRNCLLEKAPLLAFTALASAMTLLTQGQSGTIMRFEALPFRLRLSNALLSYVAYLKDIFWPANLAVYYPHPGRDLSTVASGVAGLWLAALTAGALTHWKRRPWLAVGWLWYLGILVPMIGLVQVGEQARADRYVYLPSIGLFVILVWWGAENLPPPQRRPAILAPLAGAALAALAVAAALQVRHWQDSETLFRHALAVTENNWMIQNNFAIVLQSQGRHEEAMAGYREALRLKPGFVDALINLGNSLTLLGRHEEAVACYREAIRRQPPGGDTRELAQLRYNLGIPLAALGRQEEAIASFSEAVRLQPDFVFAFINLGVSLVKLGRLGEATAAFREAIRLNPGVPEAWHNLGLALAQLGGREEAVSAFREALRLRPAYPEAEAALAREKERIP
jgi:tetratricopeptide (TPR) repeat protein